MLEITLFIKDRNHGVAQLNGAFSHKFSLDHLKLPKTPLEDLESYGEQLFNTLFPAGSPARSALDGDAGTPILLVCRDEDLEQVPWEYARGKEDFLVCLRPFLRGLPREKRQPDPDLTGVRLHITAVPSNPIAESIPPLNIAGEWQRLEESVEELEHHITLERLHPPTLRNLRERVGHAQHRVLHFMGHGGRGPQGNYLVFETTNAAPDAVTARDLQFQVGNSVYLACLMACVSAEPGPTPLSNIAHALVSAGVPFAMGMRFVIPDAAAIAFSRLFYGELARGSSVSEAVFQARRELLRQQTESAWLVGVPVLYTSLTHSDTSFAPVEGQVQILAPVLDPDLGLALPQARGAFRGRVREALSLGDWMTGATPEQVMTVHGGGGQGKTALAREAVERFGHAFPGGVFAISLENPITLPAFLERLRRFLHLPETDVEDLSGVRARVLAALMRRRSLIVLDNAETLVDAALDRQDQEALRLIGFLRDDLLGNTHARLLVTSRRLLGWVGETHLPLGGLSAEEGAALFCQSAQKRGRRVPLEQARALSRRLAGHPLSLRLLGLTFEHNPGLTMQTLLAELEKRLAAAEDRYQPADHRHRSLKASIATSAARLPEALRDLLSGLWIFQASFLPVTAADVFQSLLGHEDAEDRREAIHGHLDALYRRGLLAHEQRIFRDGSMSVYWLLPTMRPYCREMRQAVDPAALQRAFGQAQADLIQKIYRNLDQGGAWAWLARTSQTDLQRGLAWQPDDVRGDYLNRLGWILARLGDRQMGCALLEKALKAGGSVAGTETLSIMNNLALIYKATGRMAEALALYEQALPIRKEVGDRAGEAVTCFNLALLCRELNRPVDALDYLRQAVALEKAVQHPDHDQDRALLARWEARHAAGESLSGGSAVDPGSMGAGAEEILAGVQQLFQADGADALKSVIKAHPALLTDAAQKILQGLAQTAKAKGQEPLSAQFDALARLLDDCRSRGTETVFEDLMAENVENQPVEGDHRLEIHTQSFIKRAAAALGGTPAEKQAFWGALRVMAAGAPGAGALIRRLELALLGEDPFSLTEPLPEPSEATWRNILQALIERKA